MTTLDVNLAGTANAKPAACNDEKALYRAVAIALTVAGLIFGAVAAATHQPNDQIAFERPGEVLDWHGNSATTHFQK